MKFVKAADFNVVDIEVKERKVAKTENEGLDKTYYDVYNTHKLEKGNFQIHFNNESTGTKVFMILALYILQNENSNKVLLIDEFDRSFHVELAEALLDVFHHESQYNQFILTTHELSLMDYNMRQDQIWFVDKNEYGETELFSIYDFDDDALRRSDFGYKRRYLEGRYKASPIINKTVLLEAFEGKYDKK